MGDFEITINHMVPMGKMRKEDFVKLREWANQNAASASGLSNSSPDRSQM